MKRGKSTSDMFTHDEIKNPKIIKMGDFKGDANPKPHNLIKV